MDGRNHVLRHHEGLSAGRVIMQEPRTPWTPGRGRAHSDTAAARGAWQDARRATTSNASGLAIASSDLTGWLWTGLIERIS